jgi:glutamate-5-semialdehyde dehydrogenase
VSGAEAASLEVRMRELAVAARDAARVLARTPTRQKDRALREASEAVRRRSTAILAANRADMDAARAAGQGAAFLDRLALDEKRLAGISAMLLEVAGLPDPVGQVTASWARPNGLQVKKVRIPLGVVLMVYEARPNVTVEAAALCMKSGNGCILRGRACPPPPPRWSRCRIGRPPSRSCSSTTWWTWPSPAADRG